MDFPTNISRMSPFAILWMLGGIFHFVANSEDPDQKPHDVAMDLGQHSLPTSHKQIVMLIWVKLQASCLDCD